MIAMITINARRAHPRVLRRAENNSRPPRATANYVVKRPRVASSSIKLKSSCSRDNERDLNVARPAVGRILKIDESRSEADYSLNERIEERDTPPRLKFVCNSLATLSAKRITPCAEILISIRLMMYVSRLRERDETDARNMFLDCRGDFVRASARIR